MRRSCHLEERGCGNVSTGQLQQVDQSSASVRSRQGRRRIYPNARLPERGGSQSSHGDLVRAMKLQIDWGEPLSMKLVSRQGAAYLVDLDALPGEPGIYIMGRGWGKSFEALYVGKARNIRQRVKGQLNNLRLMKQLQV